MELTLDFSQTPITQEHQLFMHLFSDIDAAVKLPVLREYVAKIEARLKEGVLSSPKKANRLNGRSVFLKAWDSAITEDENPGIECGSDVWNTLRERDKICLSEIAQVLNEEIKEMVVWYTTMRSIDAPFTHDDTSTAGVAQNLDATPASYSVLPTSEPCPLLWAEEANLSSFSSSTASSLNANSLSFPSFASPSPLYDMRNGGLVEGSRTAESFDSHADPFTPNASRVTPDFGASSYSVLPLFEHASLDGTGYGNSSHSSSARFGPSLLNANSSSPSYSFSPAFSSPGFCNSAEINPYSAEGWCAEANFRGTLDPSHSRVMEEGEREREEQEYRYSPSTFASSSGPMNNLPTFTPQNQVQYVVPLGPTPGYEYGMGSELLPVQNAYQMQSQGNYLSHPGYVYDPRYAPSSFGSSR